MSGWNEFSVLVNVVVMETIRQSAKQYVSSGLDKQEEQRSTWLDRDGKRKQLSKVCYETCRLAGEPLELYRCIDHEQYSALENVRDSFLLQLFVYPVLNALFALVYQQPPSVQLPTEVLYGASGNNTYTPADKSAAASPLSY
ncbi:hypothetical protein Baya_12088 [Bagarius yarrelli]|uniref:Uncharacterized protein n=1 Tax=Bagarius yarrelli TaxID=175774 RepID=A0A556V2N9_BAGYA|nr:hypothetical protein Baya_12088 [Bagarius yarrelli]